MHTITTKLQYLVDKIDQFEWQRFRQLWIQICSITNMQLQIIRQLIHIDTTAAARLLLKRNYIHARMVGQVLLIFPCTAVIVDYVLWNYQVADICYTATPVVVNESIYFITPGTRDLAPYSPKIPCHMVINGVHKEDDHWINYKGTIKCTVYSIL